MPSSMSQPSSRQPARRSSTRHCSSHGSGIGQSTTTELSPRPRQPTRWESCSTSATGLAHTYARRQKPDPNLSFTLPPAPPHPAQGAPGTRRPAPAAPPQSAEKLQELEASLAERGREARRTPASIAKTLDEELVRLRAEVAKAKKEAAAQPDTHDYSEAETRDLFIDVLLPRPAGRSTEARDREYEVTGMPNEQRQGLRRLRAVGRRRPAAWRWSRPSARRKSPQVGQQQAKLYADCLEDAVRPPPGHLLHQRLRALDLGRRRRLSAARGAGLLHHATSWS